MDKKNKNVNNKDAEINRYQKRGFFSRIPYSIKALFIKWWLFGIGFYFIYWGLSNLVSEYLSLMVLLGLFNGIITDIAVNKILELIESDKREARWFEMFSSKRVYSLFINIVYHVFLSIFVCVTMEKFIAWLDQTAGSAFIFEYGMEPITSGLAFLLFDMIFIGIKDLIVLTVLKIKAR